LARPQLPLDAPQHVPSHGLGWSAEKPAPDDDGLQGETGVT
jgi:hypothetical protein